MKAADGSNDDMVERLLAKTDSAAAPAIARLSDGKELDGRELAYICAFVAHLIVRLPVFADFVDGLAAPMTIDSIKQEFDSIEQTATHLEHLGVERDDPSHTAEELYDFVHNGTWDISIDKTWNLATRMLLGSNLYRILWGLKWRFHWSPPGFSYITSDSPVILMPQPPLPVERAGLLTPGARKFVPLSSRCGLTLYDPGPGTTYGDLPADIVEGLNDMVALNSQRFVVARTEEELKHTLHKSGLA